MQRRVFVSLQVVRNLLSSE